MLKRFGRTEIESLGLCIVISFHVLPELLFQRVALIQEYGVGNVQRDILVCLRQVLNEVLAVLIHRLYASAMESKSLFQFLFSGSGRAVVNHSQHVGDAQRREDETIAALVSLVHSLQKVHRELIVVLDKNSLLRGQLYRLPFRHHVDKFLFRAYLLFFRRGTRQQHNAACCYCSLN